MRNRSLRNARWFCGKKREVGKGNLHLSENRLSWNEMWWASDNHSNYFNEIVPNFTYSQISYFLSIIGTFLDQPLLPYKFHGSDMPGMYFFIFANCEPLIMLIVGPTYPLQQKLYRKGSQLPKWKSTFPSCPCHKIYRGEAVGLSVNNYTFKSTIFMSMWNLGQFREKLIFCQ